MKTIIATYKQHEARKEISAIAEKAGLFFKRQRAMVNGKRAYMFTCRKTGEHVLEKLPFWNAYETCMSGYLEIVIAPVSMCQYNKESRCIHQGQARCRTCLVFNKIINNC